MERSINPPNIWESGVDRFEEVGSDGDGFRGGLLPEGLYGKGKHRSNDELFYSYNYGDADLDPHFGSSRNDSYDELSYSEAYNDSEEDDLLRYPSIPHASVALRDDDEELLQRALESIRKAKDQGRASVDLGVEELTALERSRKQRIGSTSASKKERKKSSLGSVSGTVKAKKSKNQGLSITSSPKASKVKPVKPSKRASGSADDGPQSPYAMYGPGGGQLQLAAAPSGGVPVYPFVAHHRASSQSGSRPSSRQSGRSGSQGNRLQRIDTPPYDMQPSTPPISSNHHHHPRYFSAPGSSSGPSSAHASPRRDGEEWAPAAAAAVVHHNRARSSSTAASGFPPLYEQDAYPYPPYGYAAPRRSGPEITYASLRRVPPGLGFSVGAGRSADRSAHGAGVRMPSDPMMTMGTGIGSPPHYSQQHQHQQHRAREREGSLTPSMSSDEEGGDGVLVNVVSHGDGQGSSGYAIQSGKDGGSAAKGGRRRRRKG